jgi:hypothetical protein
VTDGEHKASYAADKAEAFSKAERAAKTAERVARKADLVDAAASK